MNLYIDESGTINNHMPYNKYFVIALVRPFDKESLKRSYKRFVSANHDGLRALDQDKLHRRRSEITKSGGKMFAKGKFKELKGSQFDRAMKLKFVDFFLEKPNFELYYIKISNEMMTDRFCENTARVFNYTVRLALAYFIQNGLLPDEDCCLQLDERNEKTENRSFLADYLNTELPMSGIASGKFEVSYFDSSENKLVQIADVFSNLYYSHLQTDAYEDTFQKLQEAGVLKFIFEFPK